VLDQWPLYERANGYSYDAVKIFMPAGSKQPIVVHYTEHLPPDPTSAMFWLKNRIPRTGATCKTSITSSARIISDHQLTEEEWARERATVIDEKVVEELPAPDPMGRTIR
jgi:hypothetical protein